MGAGHPKIGDEIKQADGTTGLVANVTTVGQTREMFNLTVSEAHTYYVGQDGWLVHNADGSCGLTFLGTKNAGTGNATSIFSYGGNKSNSEQTILGVKVSIYWRAPGSQQGR